MHLDSASADRLAALVLFVLGVGMLAGGYTMDRLEIRQIHPASIPGLVPMILGATLALLAAMLWVRARRSPAEADWIRDGVSWGNLWAALALALFYALVLVGRLPFFWATAIFIAVFASWFSWPDAHGTPGRLRAAAAAIVLALVASGAIAGLFRYGFLVRLP
jgi:putative tricarboxylic transport membrane protein